MVRPHLGQGCSKRLEPIPVPQLSQTRSQMTHVLKGHLLPSLQNPGCEKGLSDLKGVTILQDKSMGHIPNLITLRQSLECQSEIIQKAKQLVT